MKVQSFDRQNLPAIRSAIDAALAGVCAQYGINLQLGKVTFDAQSFSARLEATVEGESQYSLEWKRAASYGLLDEIDPDALGKTFKNGARTFKVEGLKPRSAKVICSDGGKMYLFDRAVIARRFPAVQKQVVEVVDAPSVLGA